MSYLSITGDKALDRKLKRLSEKSGNKAAQAGIKAMLTPIAQTMRKSVTASSASADLKRSARKTIKSSFVKAKGGANRGQKQAKVGFGVGKQKIPPRSGNNRGGVGVSARNIHWFVLGTRDRRSAGRDVGRIEPEFAGIAEAALKSSESTAIAKARKKIGAVIIKEAAKG